MKTMAIVVAAGRGRRMGGVAKALLEVAGAPLLCHSLRVLQECPGVDGIVVAVPPGSRGYFMGEFAARWRFPKVTAWVEGGARRQDSVRAALKEMPADVSLIAVHDAARPCISEDLVARVLEAGRRAGAAVPGIEVVDTVKEIGEGGVVLRSPERERLRAVQTPQVFSATLLRGAYEEAERKGISATDDASLVERIGHAVVVVEGSRENIKVTVPEDAERAGEILKKSQIPNPKSQ